MGVLSGARRLAANARAGRLQRSLSLAAGLSAIPLGFDIFLEHYRGSFGNRWEWSPLVVTPPLVAAGIAGACSPRAARRALPVASALYAATGLAGTVMHARGVDRRPGGFREPTYNLLMGPPLFAPGSLALVGGLGLLASILPRER